jgi:hypothetical protein
MLGEAVEWDWLIFEQRISKKWKVPDAQVFLSS